MGAGAVLVRFPQMCPPRPPLDYFPSCSGSLQSTCRFFSFLLFFFQSTLLFALSESLRSNFCSTVNTSLSKARVDVHDRKWGLCIAFVSYFPCWLSLSEVAWGTSETCIYASRKSKCLMCETARVGMSSTCLNGLERKE